MDTKSASDYVFIVKYSGNRTGYDAMFSRVAWSAILLLCQFWVYFLFNSQWWFYINYDVFCDSINDAFLKNIKRTWGVLFLVKMEAYSSAGIFEIF